MKKDQYLDEIGLSRKTYKGNFVKERKFTRFLERRKYGYDYSDIINMKISFAEWLYSHLKHYEKWNIHDLDFQSVEFQGKEYTIGEAMQLILEISRDYLLLLEADDMGADAASEAEVQADKTMEFAANLFARIMPYLWR